MTFDEIMEQVIALLKRQGRVSYRALKMRFEEVDDEYLDVLKEEILYVHPVIDDEGRGLIWTGETEATPVTTSQPNQPEPIVEQAQPVQETASLVEPYTPDAERRQLTVMFVDLVGSTSLSGELDPEDLREVVRAYQSACTDVITRYDGHVAQLLGDGLLVYFGYPQAHEDDAQRAIRSGLGIIEAIGALNTRLEQDKSIRLAVRLGIHTGLVVVGEMGGEGRQEQLALGETPNVAARIQGIAQPDTVVISADTYRLTQGFFDVETLGERDMKGVSQPIALYRALQESGAHGRLDIASVRGLTPLVGREQEIRLLIDRWEQTKDGHGQVVLLSGEAGIGKSRLVQALKDHVAVGVSYTRLECRSSPYFTNSALYPIIDMVQRTLRFQADDTSETKLEKLEQNLSQYRLPLEEAVLLLAPLLSLPVPEHRYPLLNLTPQRQRQKTMEAIVSMLLELAEREPILFILEDLHWTDPSTLELLDLLVDQTPTASIYTLLTCRPEFQPQWANRSYFTQVTLNRLSGGNVEQMVAKVTGGKPLPDEILQQLVDKTDGVPLYVEEMTKAVLESGHLKETDECYELSGNAVSLTIPATLQDSLMARLDRLMTAKAIAQYASVIGRQFSYELLQAVSELDETMLQHELGRLVEAELVYQRGLPPQALYTFKHALIQDTAYESLLRSTRHSYHRRIAEILEEQFSEMADAQPELLAHHFTEAGLNQEAVTYLYQAGKRAIERSARTEAITYFNQGLELLSTLPETLERNQQELEMQVTLGPALIALKGYGASEVGRAYTRAQEICQQLGDNPQTFQVLWGLRAFYYLRAELKSSLELGGQLLRLAQRHDNSGYLLEAHRSLGTTSFNMGELQSARYHLRQAVDLYDPQQHRTHTSLYGQDPGMVSLSYLAMTLWILGYPVQALQKSSEALDLHQKISHPYSLVFILTSIARLHQFRREELFVQERIERSLVLCSEHGFRQFLVQGQILRGWVLAMKGEFEDGIIQIEEGFFAYRSIGGALTVSYWLALLADVYGQRGQFEVALDQLGEGLTILDKTGEHFYEAELHRLKGQLLLQQSPDNAAEAETCFQKAITTARNQSAKSWELRASTSLARLWQNQGKVAEAQDLLAPVYNWFTEGFDTADLKDAKALLDELSEAR